jgi:hypothetical protein
MGVVHMWNGVAADLVPHHEWIRHAELFSVCKKLRFFRKHQLFVVSSDHPWCSTRFPIFRVQHAVLLSQAPDLSW